MVGAPAKKKISSVKPMVILKKLGKAQFGIIFINSEKFHFLTLSITFFYRGLCSKLG